MDNAVGSLIQEQKSIIIGSILGDGYLRIIKGRKDAFLEINHSIKQQKYVEWKYQKLNNLVGSLPRSRKGKGTRIAYRFYTKQHPELTKLLHQFYQNGKKIFPEKLILDPIMLAIWYMDDGSQCRSSDVYLNTQQFDNISQQRIISALLELNLQARLNKDKSYFRIRFLKASLPKLKKLIKPYIIPPMRYKIEL